MINAGKAEGTIFFAVNKKQRNEKNDYSRNGSSRSRSVFTKQEKNTRKQATC